MSWHGYKHTSSTRMATSGTTGTRSGTIPVAVMPSADGAGMAAALADDGASSGGGACVAPEPEAAPSCAKASASTAAAEAGGHFEGDWVHHVEHKAGRDEFALLLNQRRPLMSYPTVFRLKMFFLIVSNTPFLTYQTIIFQQ